MIPKFCPNSKCKLHITPYNGAGEWFALNGVYHSRVSGKVQRFYCKSCGRHFSEQTFSLDFMVKKKLSYSRIFNSLNSGSGIRSIGRELNVSHRAILNRCSRLARQALAINAALLGAIFLNEDLVADGFESFVASQYFPCSIHLLAGKESQFMYGYDYAHLARKGRMTDKQKIRKADLEKAFVSGKRSAAVSFSAIVELVELLFKNRLIKSARLFTDENPLYPAALRRSSILDYNRQAGLFSHARINSKKARNLKNNLFSVNYLDREIRKDCANHARETVQYSRDVSNCMERFAIYCLYHNCVKPFRVDDPEKKKLLHAEVAGVNRSLVSAELKTLFTERRFLTRTKLRWGDALIWLKGLATPLKMASPYVPAYAWD